jgi:hypothetical protein
MIEYAPYSAHFGRYFLAQQLICCVHVFWLLRMRREKHLSAQRNRPFAAAQGDKKGSSIGINLSHKDRQEAG